MKLSLTLNGVQIDAEGVPAELGEAIRRIVALLSGRDPLEQQDTGGLATPDVPARPPSMASPPRNTSPAPAPDGGTAGDTTADPGGDPHSAAAPHNTGTATPARPGKGGRPPMKLEVQGLAFHQTVADLADRLGVTGGAIRKALTEQKDDDEWAVCQGQAFRRAKGFGEARPRSRSDTLPINPYRG